MRVHTGTSQICDHPCYPHVAFNTAGMHARSLTRLACTSFIPKRRFWKEEQEMQSLWRAKKSHFRASVESGMKIVDKKLDNNKSNDLGRKTPKNVIVWTIGIHLGALTFPNACFCSYRSFLSTFSCAFYPRPESATFLLATVMLGVFSCNAIDSLNRL